MIVLRIYNRWKVNKGLELMLAGAIGENKGDTGLNARRFYSFEEYTERMLASERDCRELKAQVRAMEVEMGLILGRKVTTRGLEQREPKGDGINIS